MLALLPEMKPLDNEARALLQLSSVQDREDVVGYAATQLIKFVRGD
jgi:hypothetical protein